MASQFDLAPRLAAISAAGLRVNATYRGVPSLWLTSALDDVDLCVVNIKGTKADDTVVMLRLSKLEELLAAATAVRT